MASTKMPTSNAKTAYGLLSDVRRLILEEPKRYRQYDLWLWKAERGDLPPRGYPDCGTVGCVAGWVATLRGNAQSSLDVFSARTVLGLDEAQWQSLTWPVQGAPQTRAHARSGAAHIARFQKKYAAQLKAKKV